VHQVYIFSSSDHFLSQFFVEKLKDLICLSVAQVFDILERMPWNIGTE